MQLLITRFAIVGLVPGPKYIAPPGCKIRLPLVIVKPSITVSGPSPLLKVKARPLC